jgi:hypothetical protein
VVIDSAHGTGDHGFESLSACKVAINRPLDGAATRKQRFFLAELRGLTVWILSLSQVHTGSYMVEHFITRQNNLVLFFALFQNEQFWHIYSKHYCDVTCVWS